MKTRFLFFILAAILLLAGCQAGEPSQPPATATSVTPAETAAPVATATPAATTIPTSTPIPTPEPVPAEPGEGWELV